MSVDLTAITINAFENVNLFNAQSPDIVKGYHLSPVTGVPSVTATGFISHFIQVEEGQDIYFFSNLNYGCRFVAAFDASFVNVPSAGSTTTKNANEFYTVPAGIKYIKFSSYLPFLDCSTITLSLIGAFKPYGMFGSYDHFTQHSARTNLYGKSLISYGDSITGQGLWQGQVSTMLGMIHTAYGVGGSLVTGAAGSSTAMCQTARISALPDTADVILVMGGTNDFGQSVAIGNVYDTDPVASFCGGLNTMYTALGAKYTRKKLIALTPIYSERTASYSGLGWANAQTNLAGKIMRDYANAVIAVAAYNGIPCIDVGGNCRINKNNVTTYLKDESDRVHPNDMGGCNMGSVVIRDLIKLVNEMATV